MTVTKLLSYHIGVLTGDLTGRCVLCGFKTHNGHSLKSILSDNFTAWSFLAGGDVICEHCASALKNMIFRRRSWIVNKQKLIILRKNNILNAMFNPLEPPFFLYISNVGQKRGWLKGVNFVATSKNKYFFAVEKFDTLILFEKELANEFKETIEELIKYKVTKNELKTGCFKSKTYERSFKYGFEELLFIAKQNVKNPLWEVIIDVI